jgi:hypothetical protein
MSGDMLALVDTASEWLSLGGAFFSFAGVALALYATTIMRRATRALVDGARTLWQRLPGMQTPPPIIGGVAATELDDFTSNAEGTVTLPPTATDSERIDFAEEQLATLFERLRSHQHAELTALTSRLAAVGTELSAAADKAKSAEHWSYWAFGLALIGALLQLLAVLTG